MKNTLKKVAITGLAALAFTAVPANAENINIPVTCRQVINIYQEATFEHKRVGVPIYIHYRGSGTKEYTECLKNETGNCIELPVRAKNTQHLVCQDERGNVIDYRLQNGKFVEAYKITR